MPANSIWLPDGRNSGYWYKKNKLYIYCADQLRIISAAPKARAFCSTPTRQWTEYTPSLKLVYPYRATTKTKTAPKQQTFDFYTETDEESATSGQPIVDKRYALNRFRLSLPRELANTIDSFPGRQFSVIRLWQRYSAFQDLLRSNRPLAFCVANSQMLGRPFPPRKSAMRQREILEYLGFPSSKSAVRIFRRLCPESLHEQNLTALRGIFCDPKKVKILQHMPKINAGVLQLISDNEVFAVVTPGFIAKVALKASEKYCARAADMVHEILLFDSELSESPKQRKLTSIARAEALHTELGLRYAKVNRQNILKTKFPRPPLAGTREIMPVRTPRDLVAEGERQHNCVATYARQIESGDIYVYRVMTPQRATLSVRRQSHGSWSISELRAACNENVSPQTTQLVNRWLNSVAHSCQ